MNTSEGGCQEEMSRLYTFDHSDHWSVPKSVAGSESARSYTKGAMMSFIELQPACLLTSAEVEVIEVVHARRRSEKLYSGKDRSLGQEQRIRK